MPSRLPSIRRHLPGYLLMAAVFLILGILLIYPIILMVGGALTQETRDKAGNLHTSFTLNHLWLIFKDPILVQGIWNSILIAAATTLVALFIALPLAILSAKYRYPLKRSMNALILIPLILPPFVGAIGISGMFGRDGAVNALLGTSIDFIGGGGIGGWATFWSIVLVEALHLYPIIYLNASASLANLDPALDEAAENLGAGPWRRFFRITLPLIRPGLFAGGTIVFIWSLTELGTPLVFNYARVAPVQILNGLREVEVSAQPFALTLIMLLLAGGIYILGRLILGGRAYAMYAKASRASSEKDLPPWAARAATAFFLLITAAAMLPHLGVILTALAGTGSWYRSILPRELTLDHFQTALGRGDSFQAIMNSLKLASAAVLVDLILGLLIAYLVVRTTLRGRQVLDTLSMLPLAVPGLVMAFGYVAMTLRWPFGKGDPLDGVISVVGATPNPIPLLICAYAIRRLPYVVRAAAAGLSQTSGELEEAAINLGASKLTAIRRIIVPLIAANLIAGALLAFSLAMLEVSDSLILAQQPRHYPITKAIYMLLNRLGDGPHVASALGVWGMMLLAVGLIGASVLIGQKLGAIFRA